MNTIMIWALAGLALTAALSVAQAPAVFQAKPVGSLKQVMRSIPYPNSEILFAVQKKAPQNDDDWQAVQNASIALAETANLITMRGRLKEDGSPVPVQKADWNKYARGLVTAAQSCYKAARAKDQAAVNKCTDGLAESCSNCHEVYRDAPQPSPAK
jgi:cytochrome c556